VALLIVMESVLNTRRKINLCSDELSKGPFSHRLISGWDHSIHSNYWVKLCWEIRIDPKNRPSLFERRAVGWQPDNIFPMDKGVNSQAYRINSATWLRLSMVDSRSQHLHRSRLPGAVYNCDAREEHSSCIHKQSGSGRLLHSIGFVGCLYNSGGQITNAFAGKSQRRKSV